MGIIREVLPAALISGIIYSDNETAALAVQKCVVEFGEIAFKSDEFDFIMTDYYTPEMGENLKKRFYCFSQPINPEKLSEVKRKTNDIENEFSRGSGKTLSRTVNIDPGYITLSKLVLASTKDYSHRIYIGDNIYAEVTLQFIKNSFIPIETTYPDYQIPLSIDFFNDVRAFVKRNRRQWMQKNE
ncbi:hypothetical protein ES708_31953 [subsurface metagenome]